VGYRRVVALTAACRLLQAAPAFADDLEETIVVSPARAPQRATDALTPVTVIPEPAIERSKAIDEVLRDDPSFATFRRSSSLVADPSSQGVNLRGIGPSGVSRALVLSDGIPINDGFGGWVYWDSIPRLAIEHVEIAPGASSALYGSAAMGGVVQLVSRPIRDRAEIEMQGGSDGTAIGALSFGKSDGRSGATLDVEGLTTSGYGVVATPGLVDINASSRHASALLRAETRVGDDTRVFLRLGGFRESENGGTELTTADVRQTDFAVGLSNSQLQLRIFGGLAEFAQERSRILPDAFQRASEAMASVARSPADDQGFSAQWVGPWGVTLGADLRRIFGRSIESLQPAVASPAQIVARTSSGEQYEGGLFLQKLWETNTLQVQAALRGDGWRNIGDGRKEQLLSGVLRTIDLGTRDDGQISPQLAIRIRATPWLALRAAAYRSFRAPTLNELYRPFQVGPVRTDANSSLGPETYYGGEAGIDLGQWLTATAFASRLEHPIVNVTVGNNEQMRENLGEARLAGVEMRGSWSPVRPILFSAAWTFVRSRVAGTSFALPQDPEHRLTGAITFNRSDLFVLTFRASWTSSQYEDDQNTLRLPGFAVFNVSISRNLTSNLEVFASAENLFDRRYLVGLQGGVATIGQPLFLRAGFRWTIF
jgi:iron complex outermembrane receptor protein